MVSIEPHGMFKLVRGIRELELATGTRNKIFTKKEKEKRKTLAVS
jgi:sialic acid synthase SpsE